MPDARRVCCQDESNRVPVEPAPGTPPGQSINKCATCGTEHITVSLAPGQYFGKFVKAG